MFRCVKCRLVIKLMVLQELPAKAVMAVVSGRPSTGPKDVLFVKWRENWNSLMAEMNEGDELNTFDWEAAEGSAQETVARGQEIQEVDLSDNTLSGVDPDLLATAMSKTRKLSLVNTGLTVVQVEKLLSLIAANCPMESLNLSANMLSMVETELMAQAINKLKDVTLIDTNLSVNQVLRIDHIF